MDTTQFFSNYWPLLALAAWFSYKWWNARRVLALLPQLKARGAVLVDVRSPAEFNAGHAPDTVNVPLGELSARADWPKDTPLVLCCASGSRSGMARLMLKKQGYQQVYNVGAWTKLL